MAGYPEIRNASKHTREVDNGIIMPETHKIPVNVIIQVGDSWCSDGYGDRTQPISSFP